MSLLSILSQGSVQIHWIRSSHDWVPLWEEKLKIAKMKLGVRPWKGGSSKWLWSIASFTLWQIHETQAAKCNLTQASLSPPAPAYRQDSLQKPQWYLLALQLQPLAEKKNSLENCATERPHKTETTLREQHRPCPSPCPSPSPTPSRKQATRECG